MSKLANQFTEASVDGAAAERRVEPAADEGRDQAAIVMALAV